MPEQYSQSRPVLDVDESAAQEANAAVARFVSELQAGWDQHDAEIIDRSLAANVAWGSPFGATVHGYDQLNAIHVKLKQQNKGGSASRYEIDRVMVPEPGVAIAHVKRLALRPDGQPIEPSSDTSGPFSEMALYVLIRHKGHWWVAAGQNTPIRPGGAV